MFERYTEQARRVLFFARYESSEFGSLAIEPEHLLLGILREGGALIEKLLPKASADAIRAAIDVRIRPAEKIATSIEIPFSTPTKHVLQYGADEADRLGHPHIAPEHLLLGLLKEGESVAASVLAAQRIELELTRQQVGALTKEMGAPSEPTLASTVSSVRVRSGGFDEYVALIKQRVEELGAIDDAAARRDLVNQIVTALDSLRDRA